MAGSVLFPIPPELHLAAKQFNDHLFWECHETLEKLWLKAAEPEKTFLQGIIQIAAGFVHVQRANVKGAERKLGAGLEKLFSIADDPAFQSLMNLTEIISKTQAALYCVKQTTPDDIACLTTIDFPKLAVNQNSSGQDL